MIHQKTLLQNRLSAILFELIKYGLFVLIFINSSNLTAQEIKIKKGLNGAVITQDSLVIRKYNGKKKYIIEKGEILKVWTENEKLKGEFLYLKSDTLFLSANGSVVFFKINTIRKIKIYNNSITRKIIGGSLKLWGGAIIGATIIAPLANGEPEFLIFAIVGLPAGYGIYKFGEWVSGSRKLNLRKKWHIKI